MTSSGESPSYDLRCQTVLGQPVRYRVMPQQIGDFVYEGRIAEGALTMWTALGYWREDGRPCNDDLVLAQREEVQA